MIIRDATPADLAEITRIYADSVLNGVASYELVAPDEAEMERRMSAIRDSGYPYLVAEGGDDEASRLRLCFGVPDPAGLSLAGRGFDLPGARSARQGCWTGSARSPDRAV
jgi:hypothetical protein